MHMNCNCYGFQHQHLACFNLEPVYKPMHFLPLATIQEAGRVLIRHIDLVVQILVEDMF